MKVKYISAVELVNKIYPEKGVDVYFAKDLPGLYAVNNKGVLYYYITVDSAFSNSIEMGHGYHTIDEILKAVQYRRFTYIPTKGKALLEIAVARLPKDDAQETQLGVELELESKTDAIWSTDHIPEDKRYLIDNIGWDCSLRKGREIRFKHPSLKNWKFKDIKAILDACKEGGADALKHNTAGMHIHVSGKNIKGVCRKAQMNIDFLNKILKPIGCRDTMGNGEPRYYGIGSDIFNNQEYTFNTAEFRAWAATLDAKVFYNRLKIAKHLFEFLGSDKEPQDFFKAMPKYVMKAYMFLYNHPENPHKYGTKTERGLKKLMKLKDIKCFK